MQDFSAFPHEMVASLWRNKKIIKIFIDRDISGRYKNSYLGTVWAILNPIWMLIVYTFIFSSVFSAKWDQNIDSHYEYALILYLGLILFNIFSECATKSANVINNNINYVTKIVFPLEILPIVILGSALYHAILSLFIWYIAFIFIMRDISLGIILLPIYVMPLIFFCAGLSWILAALSVYIRDLLQIINPAVAALMFLTPIFYPISALPVRYRALIEINPLTAPIEGVRNLLIWGHIPNLNSYLTELFISFCFASLDFK